MTALEMYKKVEEVIEANENEFDCIGIRFENKERTIGEVIEEYSKSNVDREDEREFPEYGTDEYDSMEELDGVSAWNATDKCGWNPVHRGDKIENVTDIEKVLGTVDHCYILGCNSFSQGFDDNEVVMSDAVVLDIIF